MDRAEFEKAVAGLPLQRHEFFKSVGSTNDIVADWARGGGSGVCLAAADEQTQGRGRAGRRWLTPAGSALAFSLLLSTAPTFRAEILGRVSGLAAISVCQALEKLYSAKPKIKWPNDVLLEDKKVCGVLPETHWSGDRLQALILGIGINVAASSVPPAESLNFPATCLEEALGQRVSPPELLRVILKELIALKETLDGDNLLQAWESRLAYKDELVKAQTGAGAEISGLLVGLAPNGALKLKMADGGMRVFQAGEIQLRPHVDTQLE